MATNRRLLLEEIYNGSIACDYESTSLSLDDVQGLCVVTSATNEEPSNQTFTSANVSLSVITITNHGFSLGLKVRFTTTDTLPSGLSAGVDYYLSPITASTFLISTSVDNALNGVYITLANGGSGTHTVNVQAALVPSIELWGTIDDEIWFLVNNSQKELSSEPFALEHEVVFFHKLKVKLIVPSGQYNVNCKVMLKGFN